MGRAEHQEVPENVKNSREIQRKQTTSYEGYSAEVGLEVQDRSRVLSTSPASNGRRNESREDEQRLMERILTRENMTKAYKRVKANKGSHGPDGMQVDELQPYLWETWPTIRQQLLEGNYHPQPVRRVEIPKPDGGKRELGIPNVIDRLIQQAVAQELTKLFDPEFSEASFGFRPRRSAHQAVLAARKHIQDGFRIVVDIDEKFFDRVNHDKLMALVARKVEDKRVLRLIRRYLEAGVLQNGVKVKSEEGTPQGGPVSPLLANILLDELDQELERRGHRFCRYADDCNIFVRSRKAGERVMGSITSFLEQQLKLKVNRNKSAVDRPQKRKYLGFSFYVGKKGEIKNRIHPKSLERLKAKVREITSRSKALTMEERITRINQLLMGWANYFKIADFKKKAQELDEWIRRRIRMCHWKQWKKIKTKQNNLVKLGIESRKAWEFANTRKGYWRIAGSPILQRSLNNQYLDRMGLLSLTKILLKLTSFS
jgi:RNA-directed DNA polymerase